jgi:NAD(P)-dependent dehydrogenase (short-subunit alcohol dehydrogenase family)
MPMLILVGDLQDNPALIDELAPLGIHATVVEPGFFRTDFMDNRSLADTGQQIADYAETVGKTRLFVVERNHLQPGDPVKFAQAIRVGPR